MPLKGIPSILSPDLLHALHSMGHGDEIVLADAHFPTSSLCRHGPKEIRADGLGIPDLLKAILKVLPLDAYVYSPVKVMEVVQRDKNKVVPSWMSYKEILDAAEGRQVPIQEVERFEFYEQARNTFAVVHTGDTGLYGNVILRKGVVTPQLHEGSESTS